MWGKRHSGRLWDILQEEADKRNSWNKNNFRMWGKRHYESNYDDDDDEYASYYWPYYDVDVVRRAYGKRASKLPSSVSDMSQLVPHGMAKNAWEKNNMRIWG